MAAYVPSLGPIWTMEMAIRLFFSQYGPFKMSGYREKKKKSCVGLPQHSGIMISEESSYSEWHLIGKINSLRHFIDLTYLPAISQYFIINQAHREYKASS